MLVLELFKRDQILKSLQKINPLFVITLLSITIIDLFILYSAAGGNLLPWSLKQGLFFVIFIPCMLIVAILNIELIYRYSYLLYGVNIVCLLVMLLVGHTAMGATRWLHLGPITFQPSEPMKLSLVLALARYFHDINYERANDFYKLIIPLVMILLPAGLIIEQPDLGTATVMIAIGAAIIFISGIETYKCVLIAVLIAIAAPIGWHEFLHDYQKKRIINFLNPEFDPQGSGYNVIQSKIAIGSGGLTGRGFLNGTQGQLEFLPEKQTDFIFTMLTEEFGFLGGFLLILLYTILIAIGFWIAFSVNTNFNRIVAYGISTFFFFHVFINIAMSMGMLPVVGIPLPLMSYGGTITATTLLSFGVLLNMEINKHVNIFKSF